MPSTIYYEAGGPDLPDARPGLTEIIAKATQMKPADRYLTAADMADDLRRWQQKTLPVDLTPPAAPPPSPPPAPLEPVVASLPPPAAARGGSEVLWLTALVLALGLGLALGKIVNAGAGKAPTTSPTPLAVAASSPVPARTPEAPPVNVPLKVVPSSPAPEPRISRPHPKPAQSPKPAPPSPKPAPVETAQPSLGEKELYPVRSTKVWRPVPQPVPKVSPDAVRFETPGPPQQPTVPAPGPESGLRFIPVRLEDYIQLDSPAGYHRSSEGGWVHFSRGDQTFDVALFKMEGEFHPGDLHREAQHREKWHFPRDWEADSPAQIEVGGFVSQRFHGANDFGEAQWRLHLPLRAVSVVVCRANSRENLAAVSLAARQLAANHLPVQGHRPH